MAGCGNVSQQSFYRFTEENASPESSAVIGILDGKVAGGMLCHGYYPYEQANNPDKRHFEEFLIDNVDVYSDGRQVYELRPGGHDFYISAYSLISPMLDVADKYDKDKADEARYRGNRREFNAEVKMVFNILTRPDRDPKAETKLTFHVDIEASHWYGICFGDNTKEAAFYDCGKYSPLLRDVFSNMSSKKYAQTSFNAGSAYAWIAFPKTWIDATKCRTAAVPPMLLRSD
ncbi:MAG: hypothetical protein HQL37_12640 [Alphaproteobacteria bacterium]|nr:hypothetical protein [Alphaproteobacteria bacterium]